MRALFFILSIFLLKTVSAQDIQVDFIINSALTSFPVKGAQIKLNENNFLADSSGRLEVKMKSGQLYQLKVSHLAFKPFTVKFTCLNDTSLFVFLEPEIHVLDEVEVKVEKDNSFGISRLNNVEGTAIYAGKKSESVVLEDLNANLAANNSRQIFSKVPGINVFE